MTNDELNAALEASEAPEDVVEETPAEIPAEEPQAPAEDFFGDDGGFELPDPTRVITVMTSSGGKAYVATGEAISVSEVINRSGFNVMLGAEYYLNGSLIPTTELVPPGQTLQIVGTVKGGAL